MVNFGITVTVVLLVFYLYLLVRPERVKRNALFLIGACGLVLAITGAFFGPWASMGRDWAIALCGVFNTIGDLIALAGAFGACYAGKLPIADEQVEETRAP